MIRRAQLLGATTALALFLAACGSGNEPVADSSGGDAPKPSVAGSGHAIAYAGPAGDAQDVFTSNLAGEEPEQLTSLGGDVAFPVWSPDGSRILFVATGEAERIDTGSGDDAYARWGREGSSVTYESGRDGNPEIYLTNLDSGDTTRLTDNDLLDEWPSLSRDGGWIAWASGSEEEKNLWIMRSDGTEKRQVTEGLLFGDAFPEWSPDGGQILLTVRENDQFVLKLIDLESGDVTPIGPGAGASWR